MEQPALRRRGRHAPEPVKKRARPHRPLPASAVRPGQRPAAPPARPPTPPAPAVETLNGDPDGLKREELQKALDGAMAGFSRLLRTATGLRRNVALSFDADPAGGAQQREGVGRRRRRPRSASPRW